MIEKKDIGNNQHWCASVSLCKNHTLVKELQLQKQETILNSLEILENLVWNISA